MAAHVSAERDKQIFVLDVALVVDGAHQPQVVGEQLLGSIVCEPPAPLSCDPHDHRPFTLVVRNDLRPACPD
jgi:hypothetical protein